MQPGIWEWKAQERTQVENFKEKLIKKKKPVGKNENEGRC